MYFMYYFLWGCKRNKLFSQFVSCLLTFSTSLLLNRKCDLDVILNFFFSLCDLYLPRFCVKSLPPSLGHRDISLSFLVFTL